jgi:hypothetical protein
VRFKTIAHVFMRDTYTRWRRDAKGYELFAFRVT